MKTEMITPFTESQLTNIDEKKLPQIFTAQVQLLEKANQEYNNAEEKELQARKRVETALTNADKLIDDAHNVGGHTAKVKQFLWVKWTSKRDEIKALKDNLKELIEHSEYSAEAQKQLAEVQSSLMESQTALLHVQKAHMEYQKQIATATKFVFGLSAYNMGVSQSIYLNLKAILSDEKPEKLGELAQQQLFLALDQIRNQESLITRINENNNHIESLTLQIEEKQREIEEISRVDQEQDRLIAEGIEKDKEQDEQISENAQDIDVLEQQDAEQDKLIAEGIEKDKEQDEQISENAQDIDALEQQDAEQDKQISEILEQNKQQDAIIAYQGEWLNRQAATIEDLKLQIEALKAGKADTLFMYATAATAAVTFILAILHFFI